MWPATSDKPEYSLWNGQTVFVIHSGVAIRQLRATWRSEPTYSRIMIGGEFRAADMGTDRYKPVTRPDLDDAMRNRPSSIGLMRQCYDLEKPYACVSH